MAFWQRTPKNEAIDNKSADPLEQAVNSNEEDTGLEITSQDTEVDNDHVTTHTIPGGDSLHNYMAAPVSTNKGRRLNEYRAMSNHVEVSDAIDEICDSMFNLNEAEQFASLKFKVDGKVTDKQQQILQAEFDYVLSLFDFEESGFNYARTFVVEGEVTFENVINPSEPKKGILGLKIIDNDKYELLKDLKTGKLIGILLDVSKADALTLLSPDYAQGMNFFKEIDVSGANSGYMKMWNKEDKLPLLFSQITYVNTGVFDKNKTFVYPPLDKARQAYKQLVLIEDGVIIYRVARSPERLVFNISSGNTSGPKAQQQLLQMIKRFNMRKTTRQGGQGGERGVSNVYDAHQVVESFWFLKPDGSEGSDVTSIGGQSSFGELEDLKFFTRKLYRSMKVPFSRFEQPENTISQGEDITYEEYKFAKFVVRLQTNIASAVRETFYTHLKLKGIWDQYKLKNKDLSVKLQPPALYDLYQVAKLNEMKMEAYSSIADTENFSYTLAMKKILNWTDDDIKENKDMLFQEAMEEAGLDFWKEKVTEWGTLERAKKEVIAELGGEEPETGPGSDAPADKPEDSKPANG
jgi:hypothetical protein